MQLITIDMETYYDDEYSLSKLTTESYIRSELFEPIILGYKVNEDPVLTAVGRVEIQEALDFLDIENNACVAHHAAFDGLIMSHHFNHRPKRWYDTLSMARAINAGTGKSNSLAKLLEQFDVGITKDTYITNAKGMHLADFGDPVLSDSLMYYRRYCRGDVEGCFRLWKLFMQDFPVKELAQIDWVIRMFTEPCLYIDEAMLSTHLEKVRADKVRSLLEAGVQRDQVMSNDKFAELLRARGVEPPLKWSPSKKDDQGKPVPIYAFAKTDEELLDLQDHEDPFVQALVAARIGNKQTLEETRIVRLLDMAPRGPAPIFYNYCGAEQTYRLSGGDSMNWQNNKRGGIVRDAIYCDEEHVLMPSDSAQIEARTVDWLAIQEDAIDIYRKWDAGQGADAYCVMASKFYQREITAADKEERQLGKIIKLACGYQMGGERLQITARNEPYKLRIPMDVAQKGVAIYRAAHPRVVNLWKRAQSAMAVLAGAEGEAFLDSRRLIPVRKGEIGLPNGMWLKFPDMQYNKDTNAWTYQGKRYRVNIYGGKIIENLIQALARVIVMDQTMQIRKRYKVVMHSHDEPVLLVPKGQEEEAAAYAKACLCVPPTWAPDLPLNAKVAWDRRYGYAKN